MKIHLSNLFASVHLSPSTYCPNCHNSLVQIADGLMGTAWICKKCHNIYQLHLIKVPKKELNPDYMKYALNAIKKLEEK